MTRLLFINPNTTQSMTDKVQQAAKAAVGPDVVIHAATSPHGPASIQAGMLKTLHVVLKP